MRYNFIADIATPSITAQSGDYHIEENNGKRILYWGNQVSVGDGVRSIYEMITEYLKGDVLNGGYGLGVFNDICEDLPAVHSVTTVEIAQDVMNLFPSIQSKTTVIIGDYLTYQPDREYDVILEEYDFPNSQEQFDTTMDYFKSRLDSTPDGYVLWVLDNDRKDLYDYLQNGLQEFCSVEVIAKQAGIRVGNVRKFFLLRRV